MTRAEQKEQRRRAILSAGLDVFIRKGYAASKIQDIAQTAGMSVGLMFHYFDSKEKLYETLISYGITGPQNLLGNIKAEPLAFFEIAAQAIFEQLQMDPFVAKMFVLMDQARHSEGIPERVRTLLADFDVLERSSDIIRQGQADGCIKQGNPKALSIAFWAAVTGIAEEIALKPGIPIPESDWVVDILRRRETGYSCNLKNGKR